jgi:CHASE3 domain sensor protein/nitrogen-specific signal transduction histidine kinase
MKVTARGRISIGLIVSAVLLILVLAADLRTNQSYQQEANQLNTDRQIESTAASLLSIVLNAETGQRGYVITGNASYLAPYYAALLTLNTTDASLGSLVSGSANLTGYYTQLQPAISAKFAEMNRTVYLRQTEGFSAAQAVVDSNDGQVYMNEIRSLIADIINSNNVAVGQLESSTTELAADRLDFVYLLGLFGAFIIGFTYYALRQEFNREDLLLKKESQSRRQTELLQDILTHDIRNYNQISKSNAELLREEVNPEDVALVDSIIKSVDGSRDLIERTKTIAKIISTEQAALKEVELQPSIERAIALITKANPDKSLVVSWTSAETRSKVMADDLLDEVFVNVLSNAVKYTERVRVPVDISVEEVPDSVEGETNARGFAKVSITDYGKGVADAMKEKIFTRYQSSATGSGLGLSIVHALVVDRYSGRVRIFNRVSEDYTKGTRVEIWLPRA